MSNNHGTLEDLRLDQNFMMGIVGGFLGALIGAIIWAVVTVVTNYQIGWMAVGVGFLVGIGVRKFGKGIDVKFAVIGAVFALFGCLLGNLFTNVYFLAEAFNVEVLEVLKNLTISDSVEMFKLTFDARDVLFYAIAVYEGFKFGRIPLIEGKSATTKEESTVELNQ